MAQGQAASALNFDGIPDGGAAPLGGPLTAGNVDLFKQPKVKNPDGSTSTVDSHGYDIDGKYVVLPAVTPDGRHLKTDDEIVGEYKKTGRHLGIFANQAAGDAYGRQLHEDYAAGKYDLNFSGIPDESPAKASKQAAVTAAATNPGDDEDVVVANLRAGARMARGAVRGAVGTVQTLASPIRRAFGMAPATPPPEETTVAGKIGRTAEQVGEFFVPEAAAGKVAEVAGLAGKAKVATKAVLSAAGTYGVAKGQGESNKGAGVAAGLAGASPLLELAAPTAYRFFRTGAKQSLMKALGVDAVTAATQPTFAKRVAQIVPVALDDGIKASWGAWLRQTGAKRVLQGAQLEQHLAGPAGSIPVPVKPVIDALEELKDTAARSVLKAEETAGAARAGVTAPAPSIPSAVIGETTPTDIVEAANRRGFQPAAPGTSLPDLIEQRNKELLDHLGGRGPAGPAGAASAAGTGTAVVEPTAAQAAAGAAVRGQQLVSGKITYNKRLLKEIDNLQSILRQHGDMIPARVLHDLKESWQEVVYSANQFENRAKLIKQYKKRAADTAIGAIRSVLDSHAPSIAALDKATSLAINLNEVVKKAAGLEDIGNAAATITSKARSAIGRRAATLITGNAIGGAVTGGAIGYESRHTVGGALTGAAVGAATAGLLHRAFTSPGWRTLPATTKNRIAEAIANGDADLVRRLITPMVAAAGSTAGQSR